MRTRWTVALFAGFLFLAPSVAAQWPGSTAVDLLIADRTGGQTIPLIESSSDGGTYIAWFDPASGNFDVYLQRLNAAGVEMWAHNGVLVSSHPQNSALFGWDMIVDSNDNAIVVFSDERDGNDLDIQAYKVGKDGQLLWGANGVTLSSNPDFEPRPRVAEASDGDFVFVWGRDPSTGDGDIMMQRLSPDGVPRFAAGGITLVAAAGESPGFPEIAPAGNGSVIVSWLRSIANFASPRHIRAQRFSSTGAPVWGSPVEVYNAFSVPIGYGPGIVDDGNGGALLWWHRSDGTFFNAFVQHLDSDGTELFLAGGVAVSTTANMHHIDPALVHDRDTGEIFVFWNERSANQALRGIFGQKLSAAGARQWTDGGKQLMPVDAVTKSAPRAVGLDDGAIVFLIDVPIATDRLIAIRVDTTGDPVWAASPVVLSSAASGKSRYPVTIDRNGVGKVVWEDDRGVDVDLYGQNVNPSGSLGIGASPGRTTGLVVGRSVSTPGDLLLQWDPSCTLGALDYGVYEGEVGNWYSHVAIDCTDDWGDLQEEIQPDTNHRYYLVVPLNATEEGSHGIGLGVERPAPAAVNRCRAVQLVKDCPP